MTTPDQIEQCPLNCNEVTDGPHPKIVISGASFAAAATASATFRMRMDFSSYHLTLAARLAREVKQVEEDNSDREFGDFFQVILGSSVGCVLMSTAAAEAYINELFADRAQHFTTRDQNLLDLVWKEYERKRLLEKFDLAHRLRTGEPLAQDGKAVQSFKRLVDLRNALTHFKPEWDDEMKEHLKLSRKLEGYVTRSPWLAGDPLFPRAWATAETTSWAVGTVLAFVQAFSVATGIPDRFSKFKRRLEVR